MHNSGSRTAVGLVSEVDSQAAAAAVAEMVEQLKVKLRIEDGGPASETRAADTRKS